MDTDRAVHSPTSSHFVNHWQTLFEAVLQQSDSGQLRAKPACSKRRNCGPTQFAASTVGTRPLARGIKKTQ